MGHSHPPKLEHLVESLGCLRNILPHESVSRARDQSPSARMVAAKDEISESVSEMRIGSVAIIIVSVGLDRE